MSSRARFRHLSAFLIVLGIFSSSGIAQAAMFVEGSFSYSSQYAGLQKNISRSGSGSLSMGLGNYVRLGLTHQQGFKTTTGYNEKDDGADYSEYSSQTQVMANSMDLTLVLYNGMVFMPFVKGGLIWKSFAFEMKQGDEVEKASIGPLGPLYNLGAGVGIRISRSYTLKLNYMVSPGRKKEPGKDPKRVLDRNTSISLEHSL